MNLNLFNAVYTTQTSQYSKHTCIHALCKCACLDAVINADVNMY